MRLSAATKSATRKNLPLNPLDEPLAAREMIPSTIAEGNVIPRGEMVETAIQARAEDVT